MPNYRQNAYSRQKGAGLMGALMGQGEGYGMVTPLADTASAAFGPAGGDFVRGGAMGARDAMIRNAGPLPLMMAGAAAADEPDEQQQSSLIQMLADPPADQIVDDIGHWGLVPAVGDYISERGVLQGFRDIGRDMKAAFTRPDVTYLPDEVTPGSLAQAVAAVPPYAPSMAGRESITKAGAEKIRQGHGARRGYLDAMAQLEAQTGWLGGR